MFRSLVPTLALALAALALGCEKFPTPAELDHATVLAVIADPPVVAPGATARLTVAVADQTGAIAPPCAWSLVETFSGVAPIGAVVANADGSATYTAPDPIPPLPATVPPVDSVQVVVGTAPAVTAIKLVGVEAGVVSTNPAIADVTLGGAPIASGGGAIAAGATATLAVTTAAPLGDHGTVAWYSTVGEIAHYQSNPTDLVAADAPKSGWIFVVVRDGAGGAAVRAVPMMVR